VNFKLALMAYRVHHGMAPAYLNHLVPVSDLPGRCCLRSSSTLELFDLSYRLATIGRRSFPVAAATVWNTLPVHVQSSPTIATFRQWLKTLSFQQSFPDIITDLQEHRPGGNDMSKALEGP